MKLYPNYRKNDWFYIPNWWRKNRLRACSTRLKKKNQCKTVKYLALKGQCQEMDLFEGQNNLISTFCVCADGFQGISKAFHYPELFICFFEITY
jgi:hypothetical protein